MVKRIARIVVLFALCVSLGLFGCSVKAPTNEVINISIWTYYNGDQLDAFQKLVSKFNDTVGEERGYVVESYNLGSVNDLQDAVLDSVNGKIGAQPVPNIFAAYADTAFAIDQMGLLADLGPYLSSEERALYVDGYLEEGTLGAQDSIKIFPVAKSVEVLVLNATDFAPFAAETGTSYEDMATIEGLVEVAQRYYEWTDASTPTPNDGKAFFGRDSLANYFYIGAKQLGCSIADVTDGQVVLDFDKQTVRKLWDNYYVPYIKGYFSEAGHYRSDDVKAGRIIAGLTSSSGATFFPNQVVDENGLERDVEMEILPCPQFEGGAPFAVQQGAGMVVVDTTPEEVEACVTFLEWFTEPEQNVEFSTLSGYMPVMESASNLDTIHTLCEGEIGQRMDQILDVSLETVSANTLYTPKAFENGAEFRSVLEYSLSSHAAADALVVQEALASGASLEEACAPFLTDEYFNAWYEATLDELEALIG